LHVYFDAMAAPPISILKPISVLEPTWILRRT
jgi:hypothetical protein